MRRRRCGGRADVTNPYWELVDWQPLDPPEARPEVIDPTIAFTRESVLELEGHRYRCYRLSNGATACSTARTCYGPSWARVLTARGGARSNRAIGIGRNSALFGQEKVSYTGGYPPPPLTKGEDVRWPTVLEWIGIIGTLGTLTGLVLAWGSRHTTKILAQMEANAVRVHEDTTALLIRMEANAVHRRR